MDPRTALITTDTTPLLPSTDTWQTMLSMAGALFQSGMLPQHIKSEQAAVAIIQKGIELRIPPMYALSNIIVIQGKPTANAELMLALVYRDHGDDAIVFLESSATGCTISYKRRGWRERRTYSFTLAEATQAGLKGGNWEKYPAAMLRARCASAVARMAFPDTIGGLFTPDELGAQVSIDADGGEVLTTALSNQLERDIRVIHATVEDVRRATPIPAREDQFILISNYANQLLNATGEVTAVADDLSELAADELISDLISKLTDAGLGNTDAPATAPAATGITDAQRGAIKLALDAFTKRGRTISPPPESFTALQVEDWLAIQRQELAKLKANAAKEQARQNVAAG